MESCCTVKPQEEDGAPSRCPGCGNAARAVERITVKALLTPEALARLSEAEHRFCAMPACPVVYYGREEIFDREEISAPVFQKEPAGERTVCYCFAVTEADLRREIAETGRSTAPAEITAHVKAERCACEIKNPQGSCCLGNVAGAIREAMAAVGGAARGGGRVLVAPTSPAATLAEIQADRSADGDPEEVAPRTRATGQGDPLKP